MRRCRFSTKSPGARILCVSNRDIAPLISRCLQYELEDLIASVDDVDVIAPSGSVAHEGAEGLFQATLGKVRQLSLRALQRLSLRLEQAWPIAGRRRLPAGLSRHYDLVFLSTESVADLRALAPCAMWRSTARVSACYIEEIYAADIPALGSLLDLLKRFDHIFVADAGTAEPLAQATGRPCHHIPPSTDALKFCPYPSAPERVIDFYAMGRRPEQTHNALLRIAATDDFYYMYDTVKNSEVTSYVEHRNRLADMIKRSRYFLVNLALFNNPERTGGQQELGFRYFEGAAGGAILVGDVPDTQAFHEWFGWEDAVIPLPDDSDQISAVMSALDADPTRCERISKTNVVNSLRRHDHVYRWAQVLSAVGLPETEAMQRRKRALSDLAESIDRTIPQSELEGSANP